MTSRTFTRFGLTLVIAALIVTLVPIFIDRREYARAVNAYASNPTLENGVVLANEYATNRRIILLTRLGVGAVLFVIMNVAWTLVSRNRDSPTRP